MLGVLLAVGVQLQWKARLNQTQRLVLGKLARQCCLHVCRAFTLRYSDTMRSYMLLCTHTRHTFVNHPSRTPKDNVLVHHDFPVHNWGSLLIGYEWRHRCLCISIDGNCVNQCYDFECVINDAFAALHRCLAFASTCTVSTICLIAEQIRRGHSVTCQRRVTSYILSWSSRRGTNMCARVLSTHVHHLFVMHRWCGIPTEFPY